MLMLERIASDMTICRSCGDKSEWRIVFIIGYGIRHERVDMCDGCVVELSGLAEAKAATIAASGFAPEGSARQLDKSSS